MASCQDLSRLSPAPNYRSLMKATPVPIFTSKRLIDPLNRLKTRANLFRRQNYSSQLDISSPRPSLVAEHISPCLPPTNETKSTNHHVVLKRSNSMVSPQQHLQSFLKNSHHHHHRNSICVQLTDCPIDESSTDDYRLNQPSSTRSSKMSNIKEQEPFPSDESLHEGATVPNNNSSLSTPPITPNILLQEQQVPSAAAVVLRSADVNPIRRQSPHVQQRQSTCSSLDEPFYDCKQATLPETFEVSLPKISTCTMTGKSLDHLAECLSMTSSSEDKCVQTTFNDSIAGHSCTSLSSTTSIQTDSLEHNQKIPILNKTKEISKDFSKIQERLLTEQTCIYWVNYLGSTAIKISPDNTSVAPTHAITRLKQSTQYARVLPIIGLSISSRGVEFLKHAKDRLVICFHNIKTIHCACQDQDLRYFAYVTREQRLVNGTPTRDRKQQSSPALSIRGGDYHDYCHVFVVKNEAMSTEILLTFGQAFDIAYQHHCRLSSKQIYAEIGSPSLLPSKSKRMMSSSLHSPGPSSSSSSSSDDQRIFV